MEKRKLRRKKRLTFYTSPNINQGVSMGAVAAAIIDSLDILG